MLYRSKKTNKINKIKIIILLIVLIITPTLAWVFNFDPEKLTHDTTYTTPKNDEYFRDRVSNYALDGNKPLEVEYEYKYKGSCKTDYFDIQVLPNDNTWEGTKDELVEKCYLACKHKESPLSPSSDAWETWKEKGLQLMGFIIDNERDHTSAFGGCFCVATDSDTCQLTGVNNFERYDIVRTKIDSFISKRMSFDKVISVIDGQKNPSGFGGLYGLSFDLPKYSNETTDIKIFFDAAACSGLKNKIEFNDCIMSHNMWWQHVYKSKIDSDNPNCPGGWIEFEGKYCYKGNYGAGKYNFNSYRCFLPGYGPGRAGKKYSDCAEVREAFTMTMHGYNTDGSGRYSEEKRKTTTEVFSFRNYDSKFSLNSDIKDYYWWPHPFDKFGKMGVIFALKDQLVKIIYQVGDKINVIKEFTTTNPSGYNYLNNEGWFYMGIDKRSPNSYLGGYFKNITVETLEEVNCIKREHALNLRNCINDYKQNFYDREIFWEGNNLIMSSPGPDKGRTCRKGFSCDTMVKSNCSCDCDTPKVHTGLVLEEKMPYVKIRVDDGVCGECYVKYFVKNQFGKDTLFHTDILEFVPTFDVVQATLPLKVGSSTKKTYIQKPETADAEISICNDDVSDLSKCDSINTGVLEIYTSQEIKVKMTCSHENCHIKELIQLNFLNENYDIGDEKYQQNVLHTSKNKVKYHGSYIIFNMYFTDNGEGNIYAKASAKAKERRLRLLEEISNRTKTSKGKLYVIVKSQCDLSCIVIIIMGVIIIFGMCCVGSWCFYHRKLQAKDLGNILNRLWNTTAKVHHFDGEFVSRDGVPQAFPVRNEMEGKTSNDNDETKEDIESNTRPIHGINEQRYLIPPPPPQQQPLTINFNPITTANNNTNPFADNNATNQRPLQGRFTGNRNIETPTQRRNREYSENLMESQSAIYEDIQRSK